MTSPSDRLLRGVDVSRWQGGIDWVAAAASGLCEFAYVKATNGGSGVDERFAENWAGTLFAKIPRGAYHFMTVGAAAEAQARHFLAVYPGDGELPPALDLERGLDGGMPTAAEAAAWLRIVREETGVAPVVYISPSFAAQQLRGPAGVEIAQTCDLWVAHWVAAPAPYVPPAWSSWRFWQTGTGRVPGIRGEVDVDVMKQQ